MVEEYQKWVEVVVKVGKKREELGKDEEDSLAGASADSDSDTEILEDASVDSVVDNEREEPYSDEDEAEIAADGIAAALASLGDPSVVVVVVADLDDLVEGSRTEGVVAYRKEALAKVLLLLLLVQDSLLLRDTLSLISSPSLELQQVHLLESKDPNRSPNEIRVFSISDRGKKCFEGGAYGCRRL